MPDTFLELFQKLSFTTLSYLCAETVSPHSSSTNPDMYLNLFIKRLFFGFIEIVEGIVGVCEHLIS